jgi:hypothetical protein
MHDKGLEGVRSKQLTVLDIVFILYFHFFYFTLTCQPKKLHYVRNFFALY